jgi:hypothetical protein
MKKAKHHFLRALAETAEAKLEASLAGASGYKSADAMLRDLSKDIFSDSRLKSSAEALHKKALALDLPKPKLKLRTDDVRKKSGRGQASRLQPRGHER